MRSAASEGGKPACPQYIARYCPHSMSPILEKNRPVTPLNTAIFVVQAGPEVLPDFHQIPPQICVAIPASIARGLTFSPCAADLAQP
jgi:hypothetical protein